MINIRFYHIKKYDMLFPDLNQEVDMKKNDLQKYLFSLLLFGSNGIVARFIALDSMHICLLYTSRCV